MYFINADPGIFFLYKSFPTPNKIFGLQNTFYIWIRTH